MGCSVLQRGHDPQLRTTGLQHGSANRLKSRWLMNVSMLDRPPGHISVELLSKRLLFHGGVDRTQGTVCSRGCWHPVIQSADLNLTPVCLDSVCPSLGCKWHSRPKALLVRLPLNTLACSAEVQKQGWEDPPPLPPPTLFLVL